MSVVPPFTASNAVCTVVSPSNASVKVTLVRSTVPAFQTLNVQVTGVLEPSQTWSGLTVFSTSMSQSNAVTVAVSVAVAVAFTGSSNVAVAVALLVVVTSITRVCVSVVLIPGPRPLNVPTVMSSLPSLSTSSTTVPEALKKSPVFLTT